MAPGIGRMARRAALPMLLAALLLAAGAGSALAEEAETDDCEEALLGEGPCSVLNDIPLVGSVYGYLGDVHRAKVEAATSALGDVVADDFVEEWVKGMAESTVSLLAYIQALGEKVTQPAFDQRWWASQYATTFGLSLLLLAFLLVWITGRFAASGSPSTGVDLLRQSGWRLVFVLPLISAGPVVLLELQLVSSDLARAFADEGREHAGSAVEQLMDLIVEKAGDWGVFGGTVLALLLFLGILCLGLVALIEMTIAQWGLHLGGLLIPLVLVAWVYPPWSNALRRLAALLAGLMLLPSFIYFFFNTIWSAFDSVMRDNDGDGLSILLFLLVGLLMIDAFPLVVMWLMSLTLSSASGMDPQVRGAIPHPSAGEMGAEVLERFEARSARIGTSAGGGDADNADAAPSQGPQAMVPHAPERDGSDAEQAALAASGGGPVAGAGATVAAGANGGQERDRSPDSAATGGSDPAASAGGAGAGGTPVPPPHHPATESEHNRPTGAHDSPPREEPADRRRDMR